MVSSGIASRCYNSFFNIIQISCFGITHLCAPCGEVGGAQSSARSIQTLQGRNNAEGSMRDESQSYDQSRACVLLRITHLDDCAHRPWLISSWPNERA